MGGLRFVFSSLPFSSAWTVMNSVDPLGTSEYGALTCGSGRKKWFVRGIQA